MNPLTVMVGALAAGAATSEWKASPQLVKDSYGDFKDLLLRRFGAQAGVRTAVHQLEKKPDSEGRQRILEEELEGCGAGKDPRLVQRAEEILALLKTERFISGETCEAMLASAQALIARAMSAREDDEQARRSRDRKKAASRRSWYDYAEEEGYGSGY